MSPAGLYQTRDRIPDGAGVTERTFSYASFSSPSIVRGRGIADLPDFHGTGSGFEKRLSFLDANGAIAGRGGEETAEVTLDGWLQEEHFVHGVVPCAAERLEQSVGGKGARIPMSAFLFVERVPHAPIITSPEGAHDRESLGHHPLEDHAAGNLIFDASPDFIAVGERQG